MFFILKGMCPGTFSYEMKKYRKIACLTVQKSSAPLAT